VSRRQLIIIPGLGDRGRLYRLLMPLWLLMGYRVHIFVFGWEQGGLDLAMALTRLTAFIDSLDGRRVYVIGVSAGGTAAINALAERPTRIARVITVCTPYEQLTTRDNDLLRASVRQASIRLLGIDPKTRHKILSVYGLYDEVVSIAMSQPEDIAQKQIWLAGHGLTICLALTFYSHTMRQFFGGPHRMRHGRFLRVRAHRRHMP
jgi:pimeloyl-ACP methyl ester carboxylesterase